MPAQPLTDVSAGDWIAPRLGPESTVSALVPRGFAGYARILHPAPTDPPTRWAQVCAATGVTPHALMRWSEITRGDEDRWGWEAGGGMLDLDSRAALRAVLGTGRPWFGAVWAGWGWLGGGGVERRQPDGTTAYEELPRHHVGVPQLLLPHREYLLFTGSPAELTGRPHEPSTDPSPSLLWPADHSWFVAGDVDLDSTWVGGPADLIAAVLAAPGLEAWPAAPDDLLR